ncbi:MAG: extracellular solute-binding protein [Nocardioides sp.]
MTRTAGRRRAPILACLFLLVALAGAACEEEPTPAPGPGPGPTNPTKLTFGVWGNEEEIAAYQEVVDTYNESAETSEIQVRSWPDSESMVSELEQGGRRPDLFLLSRRDLKQVLDEEQNTPLTELLDERGIDYGDGYSRDALLGFSAADELQCMPYDISPMVVYYNTELVDFDRMRERELLVPPIDPDTGETSHASWNFEAFRVAAEFASRPRKGSKGVHVDPTLSGLAPFMYAGGGNVFDDETDPTSLAFSDEESRDALLPALELFRDPQLTLTEEMLAEATPVQWFERGKLGMLVGPRALVPELRAVSDLEFDVMPIPVLDDAATIGDTTGLCISREAASIAQTADFLVYLISSEAVSRVASAGYLVPANLQVAVSDDFLQPDREPANAGVFNASIRNTRLPPLLDTWPELELAVESSIGLLLSVPVLDDLEPLTIQIDEQSRAVLDPESVTESADPSSE